MPPRPVAAPPCGRMALPAASSRSVRRRWPAWSSTTSVWIVSARSDMPRDASSLSPATCATVLPAATAWYGVVLAKPSLRASICPVTRTLTTCSCSEAWMTLISTCPEGTARVSLSTCSRSPAAGPMPATV